MITDMDELVGAKTKPPFSNLQQFSLDYSVFSCLLESSHFYTITKYFLKIIIALYKRPLDAYGLKLCEQNDSLNLSDELGGAYKRFYTSIGLSIKVSLISIPSILIMIML